MTSAQFSDDDYFYRRLHASQIVEDANLGRRRPSSAGLTPRSDEPTASVYIKSLMDEHGLSEQDPLHGHPGFGLAGVGLGVARQPHLGYDVVLDPDGIDPDNPHPCDPAHCGIVEPSLGKNAAMRRRGELAKHMDVLVDPDA